MYSNLTYSLDFITKQHTVNEATLGRFFYIKKKKAEQRKNMKLCESQLYGHKQDVTFKEIP